MKFTRALAIGSAGLATVLLLALHLMNHGRELSPIHNWISEYVLSESPLAVIFMRSVFVALAIAALASASHAVGRQRAVLGLSGFALGGMMFFDTDPNDGRPYAMQWPLTAGNIHQLLLYIGIGAALVAMALPLLSRIKDPWTFWPLVIALAATIVQTFLVARSHAAQSMTLYGGLTERIILIAALAWVIRHAMAPCQDPETRRRTPSTNRSSA